MSDSNTLREAMQRFAKAHKAYRDSPSSDRWESLCEAGTELDQETRYVALSSQAEPQASTPAGLTEEQAGAIRHAICLLEDDAKWYEEQNMPVCSTVNRKATDRLRAILNTGKPG